MSTCFSFLDANGKLRPGMKPYGAFLRPLDADEVKRLKNQMERESVELSETLKQQRIISSMKKNLKNPIRKAPVQTQSVLLPEETKFQSKTLRITRGSGQSIQIPKYVPRRYVRTLHRYSNDITQQPFPPSSIGDSN